MDVVENNFDPVREPSLSGRLALLGVVVGVMAVSPVYALLLGLNLTVTLFVLAPGAVAGAPPVASRPGGGGGGGGGGGPPPAPRRSQGRPAQQKSTPHPTPHPH